MFHFIFFVDFFSGQEYTFHSEPQNCRNHIFQLCPSYNFYNWLFDFLPNWFLFNKGKPQRMLLCFGLKTNMKTILSTKELSQVIFKRTICKCQGSMFKKLILSFTQKLSSCIILVSFLIEKQTNHRPMIENILSLVNW